MRFLTDFGDQAVILPLVVAVGAALLLQGWRRGAIAWAVAVAATFFIMLVLKLVFLACSISIGTDIRTPSGHVAATTLVTGGLAALLIRRHAIVLTLAAIAAFIIAITRLALGLHSLEEVVIGACVGLAGALALIKLAGPTPPELEAPRIGLMALAVAAVFHGVHLPAESHIRATALRAASFLGVCQDRSGSQPDQARP
jgi:membrane-associated phospholipid phosphatase